MNPETMRCPTCRATQVWSETCRRCKCDLRLLREVADGYAAVRLHCLSNLRQNKPGAALEQARQCYALRADNETRRLLAVCELLNGDWASAWTHAIQLLAERNGDAET
jgi:hypothetical protein